MNRPDPAPQALPGVPGGFQLPRLDFRSDGQIDREIDEEIAFHLDQLEREFAAEGADASEARARARERLGDIDAIKAQCRRIALEDRIMLQKVNLVVMLIVLLAVVGVSLFVAVTQKHNTLALQAITAEITNMKFEAEAASRDQAAIAEQSARAAQEQALRERERADAVTAFLQSVLVSDDPSAGGSVTLAEVLDQAETRLESFADQPELQAQIRQAIEAARQETGDDGLDGDDASPKSALSGFWHQIDERGEIIENAATLRLLAPHDIRNISGQHVGVLESSTLGTPYQVWLDPTTGGNNLGIIEYSGNRTTGRWIMLPDGVLLLNVGHRDLAPIALKRVSTEIPPRIVTVEGAVSNPGEVELQLLDPTRVLKVTGSITQKPATIELHRQIDGEMKIICRIVVDADGSVRDDDCHHTLGSGDKIVVRPGIAADVENPEAQEDKSQLAEPLLRTGFLLLAIGKELLALQTNPQDAEARDRLEDLLAEARPLADQLAADQTMPSEQIQKLRDIITRSEQILKSGERAAPP